jgi:hypothetical protein
MFGGFTRTRHWNWNLEGSDKTLPLSFSQLGDFHLDANFIITEENEFSVNTGFSDL